MYFEIEKIDFLKFNGCGECDECCRNKYFAPLILDDFIKVYKYFPILFVNLDTIKPIMLLSDGKKCPYLKDGLCSIYENRPPCCVLYPYSPYYENILIDLDCKALGDKGVDIPLSKENFRKSNFYDERVENIRTKIEKTTEWVEKQKLEPFKTIQNIEIYKLIPTSNDKFSEMVSQSQKLLDNYIN